MRPVLVITLVCLHFSATNHAVFDALSRLRQIVDSSPALQEAKDEYNHLVCNLAKPSALDDSLRRNMFMMLTGKKEKSLEYKNKECDSNANTSPHEKIPSFMPDIYISHNYVPPGNGFTTDKTNLKTITVDFSRNCNENKRDNNDLNTASKAISGDQAPKILYNTPTNAYSVQKTLPYVNIGEHGNQLQNNLTVLKSTANTCGILTKTSTTASSLNFTQIPIIPTNYTTPKTILSSKIHLNSMSPRTILCPPNKSLSSIYSNTIKYSVQTPIIQTTTSPMIVKMSHSVVNGAKIQRTTSSQIYKAASVNPTKLDSYPIQKSASTFFNSMPAQNTIISSTQKHRFKIIPQYSQLNVAQSSSPGVALPPAIYYIQPPTSTVTQTVSLPPQTINHTFISRPRAPSSQPTLNLKEVKRLFKDLICNLPQRKPIIIKDKPNTVYVTQTYSQPAVTVTDSQISSFFGQQQRELSKILTQIAHLYSLIRKGLYGIPNKVLKNDSNNDTNNFAHTSQNSKDILSKQGLAQNTSIGNGFSIIPGTTRTNYKTRTVVNGHEINSLGLLNQTTTNDFNFIAGNDKNYISHNPLRSNISECPLDITKSHISLTGCYEIYTNGCNCLVCYPGETSIHYKTETIVRDSEGKIVWQIKPHTDKSMYKNTSSNNTHLENPRNKKFNESFSNLLQSTKNISKTKDNKINDQDKETCNKTKEKSCITNGNQTTCYTTQIDGCECKITYPGEVSTHWKTRTVIGRGGSCENCDLHKNKTQTCLEHENHLTNSNTALESASNNYINDISDQSRAYESNTTLEDASNNTKHDIFDQSTAYESNTAVKRVLNNTNLNISNQSLAYETNTFWKTRTVIGKSDCFPVSVQNPEACKENPCVSEKNYCSMQQNSCDSFENVSKNISDFEKCDSGHHNSTDISSFVHECKIHPREPNLCYLSADCQKSHVNSCSHSDEIRNHECLTHNSDSHENNHFSNTDNCPIHGKTDLKKISTGINIQNTHLTESSQDINKPDSAHCKTSIHMNTTFIECGPISSNLMYKTEPTTSGSSEPINSAISLSDNEKGLSQESKTNFEENHILKDYTELNQRASGIQNCNTSLNGETTVITCEPPYEEISQENICKTSYVDGTTFIECSKTAFPGDQNSNIRRKSREIHDDNPDEDSIQRKYRHFLENDANEKEKRGCYKQGQEESKHENDAETCDIYKMFDYEQCIIHHDKDFCNEMLRKTKKNLLENHNGNFMVLDEKQDGEIKASVYFNDRSDKNNSLRNFVRKISAKQDSLGVKNVFEDSFRDGDSIKMDRDGVLDTKAEHKSNNEYLDRIYNDAKNFGDHVALLSGDNFSSENKFSTENKIFSDSENRNRKQAKTISYLDEILDNHALHEQSTIQSLDKNYSSTMSKMTQSFDKKMYSITSSVIIPPSTESASEKTFDIREHQNTENYSCSDPNCHHYSTQTSTLSKNQNIFSTSKSTSCDGNKCYEIEVVTKILPTQNNCSLNINSAIDTTKIITLDEIDYDNAETIIRTLSDFDFNDLFTTYEDDVTTSYFLKNGDDIKILNDSQKQLKFDPSVRKDILIKSGDDKFEVIRKNKNNTEKLDKEKNTKNIPQKISDMDIYHKKNHPIQLNNDMVSKVFIKSNNQKSENDNIEEKLMESDDGSYNIIHVDMEEEQSTKNYPKKFSKDSIEKCCGKENEDEYVLLSDIFSDKY